MKNQTLADYWLFLNNDDRVFILCMLQHKFPGRYDNLPLAALALVDLKLIKSVFKHSAANKKFWQASRWSWRKTQLKSSRRRILKRLNPERLRQLQDRAYRQSLRR